MWSDGWRGGFGMAGCRGSVVVSVMGVVRRAFLVEPPACWRGAAEIVLSAAGELHEAIFIAEPSVEGTCRDVEALAGGEH